jgi:hypothetical protein
MGMREASAYTIKTEAALLEAVKADGVAFGTQADARRLVKRGLLERTSGIGHGAGNTPVWIATEALKSTWAAEETADAEVVHCLGGAWPVLEDRGDRVLILRKGSRIVVDRSICG